MGNTWFLFLGCTLLVIKQTYGYWPPDERPPLMSMGRPFHGFVVDPRSKEEKLLDQTVLNVSWISQELDHFNPDDHRIWAQRYYTNEENFRANGGNEVVFLIVGGEGVESGWWARLQGTPLMDMAKQYGAIIFDLEHRFYGRSRPFPLQTTLNMRYLTSRQAVEDIATFIRDMNSIHEFKNPRWITFGCSYPGSLSAWVHELHPELVTGSYSTSAAIEAQYDFYQYMEVVEEAITAYNPQCAAGIEQGVSEISRLIWTPEGRATLSDVFSLAPRLNETQLSYMDIAYFMFCIHVNFQTAVQYSEDNAYIYNKAGGIPNVCAIMTDTTMDPLHRLAQVNVYMTEIFGYQFTHTYARYQGYIDYVKDVNYYGDGDDAASRGWVWQTCNEFGFLQSTDTGKNIFGSQTPANLFINWCSDIFGDDFKAMQVEEKAHLTNNHYGGRERYFGKNAVFITGGADPWYPLGVYMNKSSVVSYRSPGTAHCADMYAPRSMDKPGLAIARAILKENVAKWLALPKKEHKEDHPRNIRESEAAPAEELEKAQSPGRFPEIKPIESTFETIPLPPFKEAMEPRHKTRSFYEGPAFFMGRPRGGLVPEPPMHEATDYPPGFVAGTVTQHVDNFDLSNSATYKQRYWYNPQYYQEGGPIFLFVCGESPASIKWVLNPEVEIMTAARMYNAAVYMVEHRYYGQSWPTPNQSTANLKWLNVEQALADLVNFIKGTNKKMNYINPKWVTFGGSYPGSMSAWMRQFHPDLVHAAMATSAPIEVKVDFYGYELQCQDSLRIFNPACAENIGIAFDDMHQMSLTGAGRAELSKIFALDPPWTATTPVTDLDIQHFFAIQYQNFDSIVQYNNDNRGIYANGGGMREGCAIMQNNLKSPVENLADLNKYVATYPDGTFTSTWNSYADFVKYIQNDTWSAGSDWRTWTYQTCTQFGFFESTDIGYNIWGNSVPVNYWIAMCEDIFGPEFTSKRIYKAVYDLQKWTGGRDRFKATNVMFTNGNIDPWSLQGTYVNDDGITSILMNGTAHCAEMYPPRAQDAPDLDVTRALAYQTIGRWLGKTTTAAPQTTTTSFSPRTSAYSLVMLLALIAFLA